MRRQRERNLQAAGNFRIEVFRGLVDILLFRSSWMCCMANSEVAKPVYHCFHSYWCALFIWSAFMHNSVFKSEVSVVTSHPLPSRQTSRAVSEILEQISCLKLANMKSRQACSLSCSWGVSVPWIWRNQNRCRWETIFASADIDFFSPLKCISCGVKTKKSPQMLAWQPSGTSFSPACVKAWPQQVGLLCWHLWGRGVPLFGLRFPFLEKLEKCRCFYIYKWCTKCRFF